MNRKLASLTQPDRNASFCPVHIVRRLAALILIAINLLLPGGVAPAQAMPVHAMADCPHAMAPQPGPDRHGHAGLPVMAQCCYALPMMAEVVGAPPLLPAMPEAILRPGSDTMPVSIALGPDLPPPRV